MRRIPQALGFLHLLVDAEVVLDHDEPPRNARHLRNRSADVLEMVRRDPAGNDVEAPVREREIFGAGDHVGLHARRGVDRDDRAPLLAQPPRDVAAAGRDVQHGHTGAGLAQLDHHIEIRALTVRRRLAERLRPS